MAVYKLVAQGHISTVDFFDFGVHVEAPSGEADSIAVSWAEALTLLVNGVATPADSIKQLMALDVGIDAAIANELDGTGKQVDQSIQSLALVGTDVNETLPPQVSVAVSTRTTLPTRAGRGRFYLPPFTVDTVDTFRLAATARGQVAAAAKGMLDHLNSDGFQPVIYHRFTGGTTNITAIDVGNVFDNQRRRRNQLEEVRTRLSLA
jgi:hypothetical protein